MTRILLDHDDETGRVYIQRDDSPTYGALPVEATPEEVAEWQRVIAEFGRVQEVMYQRWKAALDAEIAKLPPKPPRELRPGETVTTITRKDLIDDGLLLPIITERIVRAAMEKQLGLPWVVIQPEVK
jgi:hypothetical protein